MIRNNKDKTPVHYVMSCGCELSESMMLQRIHNTAICFRCRFRTFIIETCYGYQERLP